MSELKKFTGILLKGEIMAKTNNFFFFFLPSVTVCKDPPYKVEESGYAGFILLIDVYFRNKVLVQFP